MDEDTSTPTEDQVLTELSDTEDKQVEETQSQEDTNVEGETQSTEELKPETEGESDSKDETEESAEEETEEEDPKEIARKRYEERQRAKEESQKRIFEQNKKYLEDATDEYDERLRNMEVQQYAATVQNNENTLIGEFERVKANPDLQIFNPENKDAFNERAYDKAMRDYNAGYIQYDSYGNMIGVRGSLFEHLKETAELLGGAVKTGQVQQVKAQRNMKVNADIKPAAQPKEQKVDPIQEILAAD